MNLCKIWIEQCQAARGIEDEFGTVNALKYLVGEKFLNYLQAAEKDAEFRAEIPAFVAEIKAIFEPWQLAEYLEKAGWTEPFDPSLYDEDDEDYDPEFIEMERKDNLRRAANELLLIERAKEWLLTCRTQVEGVVLNGSYQQETGVPVPQGQEAAWRPAPTGGGGLRPGSEGREERGGVGPFRPRPASRRLRCSAELHVVLCRGRVAVPGIRPILQDRRPRRRRVHAEQSAA